jgi:AcrR family transcriptional regulator
MGSVQRRQREKEEIRRQILDASMRLFTQQGYESVTIRNIADAIEYTPGAIYSYFKDKDEIFYALHLEAFEKFYDSKKTVLSIVNPAKRLEALGDAYIKFAMENQEYYDLMFITNATGKKIQEMDSWHVGFRSFDLLRYCVKDCMDKDVLPKGDVDAVSLAIWSMVHGTASLAIRHRLPMFPEDQLMQMIRNGQHYVLESMMLKKQK